VTDDRALVELRRPPERHDPKAEVSVLATRSPKALVQAADALEVSTAVEDVAGLEEPRGGDVEHQ
jgi:hypothetical protein